MVYQLLFRVLIFYEAMWRLRKKMYTVAATTALHHGLQDRFYVDLMATVGWAHV
jgi:hypothetical protein